MVEHPRDCHCFRCRRWRSEYYTAPYTRWDYLRGAVRALGQAGRMIVRSVVGEGEQ